MIRHWETQITYLFYSKQTCANKSHNQVIHWARNSALTMNQGNQEDYFSERKVYAHLSQCKFCCPSLQPIFSTFLLQDILNVSLEIPKTGKYRVLVKYTNEGVKAQLNVALQFQNTSGANDPMIFSASLAEGCDNCLETINPDLDYLSLTNGTWMISITTMQRYDQLKLVKSQFALTPLLFYLNYIAISWYSTILLHRNVKCETDTKVVTKS